MRNITNWKRKGSIFGLLIGLASLLTFATPIEARNLRTVWASIDGVTETSFRISYGYDWQSAGRYRVIIRDATTGDTCADPAFSTYEYILDGETTVGLLDVQTDIVGYLCSPPDPAHRYTIQFDVWQIGKNGRLRLLAEVFDYWPAP